MPEEKLKSILISELKKDEEYTFNNYLKKDFQKYSSEYSKRTALFDEIDKVIANK